MKRPYLRTGTFADFVVDRFVNVPDHNEEHTLAQVNELQHLTVQILADNPVTFRPILLRTFPRFDPDRGRRHWKKWEEKMLVWDKTLNKREDEAWRYKIRVCWQSISRSAKDDLRRAAERSKDRRK